MSTQRPFSTILTIPFNDSRVSVFEREASDEFRAAIQISTRGQRAKLLQCFPGVGVVLYHHSHQTTCGVEFYVDPQSQLRYVKSGTPLELEVEDDEGHIRTVAIQSRFCEVSL